MNKDMKCKVAILAISALLLVCMGAVDVEAATSTATITMRVTIEPSSQLTLNDNSNDPNIKSGATARVKAGSSPAILTVAPGNDLTGGADIDPIAGVTATARDSSGNLLVAAPDTQGGTASDAAGAEGCMASYSETFNWYLAKRWSCSPGKNTVTVTYTLTSP
jgi:hypothetical protein